MAQYEFDITGLILVMISGGFGAVALMPYITNVSGGAGDFVLYVILSAIAAIAAASVSQA